MNSETIYTILLDQPRHIDGKTWHGFSYQLHRDEDGKIEVREHGWPTKVTLWEQDGPELDTLDEATVKSMIEAALPVDESYIIPAPPVPFVPTFTAEAWLAAQSYTPLRLLTCLDLEAKLAAASKSSPKLAAVRQWLDTITLLAAPDPDAQRTAAEWGNAPWSFADCSQEAISELLAENP